MGLKLTLAVGAVLGLGSPAPVFAQTHDPLSNIARDGSAVLGSGPDVRLVLTETDHGVEVSRILAIGDEYLDGWKIDAIAGRSVTLSKGPQKRTFALLGRPIPIGTPPPVQVAAPVIANAPPLRPANPALAAPGNQAMEAAQVAQQAGASAPEIARIFVSLASPPPSMTPDSSTARYVRVGTDLVAIAMRTTDPSTGRQSMITFSSPVREFVPPGGIASLPTAVEAFPPTPGTNLPPGVVIVPPAPIAIPPPVR